MQEVATKVCVCVCDLCCYSSSPTKKKDPVELNFGRMEGIALLFLCSTRAKVRLKVRSKRCFKSRVAHHYVLSKTRKAWEMTELLRSLSQSGLRSAMAAEKDDRDGGSLKNQALADLVRLRTVMEEMETDTVQTFNNDFRFRRIENPTFRRFDNMTLQSLVANEATVAAQLCWTFYLGSVMTLAVDLCPLAVSIARNLCALRINKVPVVPDKTVLTQEHHLAIGLWRNYAVILTATSRRPSFEFDDWVNALTKQQQVNVM